jgi:hypothetical protein
MVPHELRLSKNSLFACAVFAGILVIGCGKSKPNSAIDSQSKATATTNTQTKFYRLLPPEPWDGFGKDLVHGVSEIRGEQKGCLDLKRTGPFVPPISFPDVRPWSDRVVVTDAFRKVLESANLGRLEFCEVVKSRIVDVSDVRWDEWDLDSTERTEEIRASGGLEDFLERPHSPELANTMGDLWQVVLDDDAVADVTITGPPIVIHIRIDVKTWNGDAIFWARDRPAMDRWIIVTDHGKRWLEQHAEKWVRFEELTGK